MSRRMRRTSDETRTAQSGPRMDESPLTPSLVQIALARRGPRLDPRAWSVLIDRFPATERDRLARFRRWEDAQSSAFARLLASDLVARASDRSAANVELAQDGRGRPYVVGGDIAVS